MDVAIIGAGGVCGRQVAMQLIEARVLPASARLQLVGHQGGDFAAKYCVTDKNLGVRTVRSYAIELFSGEGTDR